MRGHCSVRGALRPADDAVRQAVGPSPAQMGLSLSAAEASVAAPFSSQVPNISAVLEVIRSVAPIGQREARAEARLTGDAHVERGAAPMAGAGRAARRW